MTGTITPLRPRGKGQSSLARFDLVAAELLRAGRASNLQTARIEVILADLREQRGHLAAMLADLRGREPTGYAQVDGPNAGLITAIDRGIVELDLFIARVRVIQDTSARSGGVGPRP